MLCCHVLALAFAYTTPGQLGPSIADEPTAASTQAATGYSEAAVNQATPPGPSSSQSAPSSQGGAASLPSSRPKPPATATSQPDSAPDPADTVKMRLALRGCLDYLERNEIENASACYRKLAQTSQGRQAEVAMSLALFTENLEKDREPPRKEMDFAEYVATGKAELIVWAALSGLWLGGLGSVAAGFNLQVAHGFFGALQVSSLLLAPVLLAGALGVATGAVTFLLDEVSAGDANLVRSAIWMGAATSMAVGVVVTERVRSNLGLIPASMLVTSALYPVGAIGLAGLIDLPPGGVALAVSGGAWMGLVSLLGLAMLEMPLSITPSVLLVAGSANVAYLGLLAASPFMPFSRPETWALDLGAALGFLTAAALAFGLRAPNPAIGYGAMAMGTVAGGAMGLGAAYFGRRLVDGLQLPELPNVVAIAPYLEPNNGNQRSPTVGLTFGFSL